MADERTDPQVSNFLQPRRPDFSVHRPNVQITLTLLEDARRSGSEYEWGAIYDAYFPDVYRLAFALTGSTPDATRVGEETFKVLLDNPLPKSPQELKLSLLRTCCKETNKYKDQRVLPSLETHSQVTRDVHQFMVGHLTWNERKAALLLQLLTLSVEDTAKVLETNTDKVRRLKKQATDKLSHFRLPEAA